MRGDRCDLGFFLACRDGAGERAQGLDSALGPAIEFALDVDGAGAGDHVADAVSEDGVSEYGRGASTVTDHLTGLLGCLTQHACAEIFLSVLEIEFLGNRHAVIADDRHTPLLFDQDGF